MADEKQQTSALFKRHEQLKRWEESDTNKCIELPVVKDKKVKFQDGCIFLAACSSGDRDEVKRLLDRGADINTANIDGLTALHQACIDDNLDMVEFLVEHKADVDVCDNEGWTPLHATASCGFTEIARYLLQKRANVAAVNNDGDLPLDICEDHDMEKLLQQAMDDQGVDAEAARHEEEDKMMEDANHLLDLYNKGLSGPEEKHPKTGATCLHVAAAKGYVKVINVLLQAGSDINAKDFDGWTPLHAAAHWGQEESCKILTENMCDMEAKNLAGQTAFDVADTELVKLLEELKLKQANLKDKQREENLYIPTVKSNRRSRNDPARSSVTRMSVEQKHNETMKNVDQEKASLDAIPVMKEEKTKSSSSSCSEEEEEEENLEESDTEKKNEINKKAIQPNQLPERDKPPLVTTVEIREKQPNKEMPKIEEMVETAEKENLKNLVDANQDIGNDLKRKSEMISDVLKKDNVFNDDKSEIQKEDQDKIDKGADKLKVKEMIDDKLKGDSFANKQILGLEHKEKVVQILISDEKQDDKLKNDKQDNNKKAVEVKQMGNEMVLNSNKNSTNDNMKKSDVTTETQLIEDIAQKKDRDKLKRTASAPPRVTEIPKIRVNSKSYKDEIKSRNEIPSWRTGLRKTGSTSTVPSQEIVNKVNGDDKCLPRSASHPQLAEESGGNENKKNDINEKARRPYLSSSSFTDADHSTGMSERLSGTEAQGPSNPYRYGSSFNSNSTMPANKSIYVPYYQRRQLENEEHNDKEKENVERKNVANNRISAPTSLQLTSTNGTTISSISTTSSPTIVNTPTSSYVYFKKPFEPPKRDEETEMLRKVRAKRARETRRSTQGVTLEEVQQANEVLRKSDNQIDPSSITATATTTTVTTSSLSERNKFSDIIKSQDVTDSVNKDINISARDSRLTSDVNLRRANSALDSDSTSLSSWRRSREDASKKDDDSSTRSSSFRRPRVDKDLSNSAPASSFYSTDSSYLPRNRSALLATDVGNGGLGGSVNLTRSASLRTDRLRTEDDTGIRLDQIRREKEKEKVSSEASNTCEKDDKRPESAAIKSRRMRRERRSTGIADYTPENKDNEEEKDKDKENKDESKDEKDKTDKTETDDKSSRYSNRYGSTSDVPTHLSSRPSSYSEYSRSTPTLDKDYKKLYEEEKAEKEKLKRDLEQCKKELRDAKVELDKQIKKTEANRLSDTTDKRERRALERKLSELEEEIKNMDRLRAENAKLKEENRALTRVVAKLSK